MAYVTLVSRIARGGNQRARAVTSRPPLRSCEAAEKEEADGGSAQKGQNDRSGAAADHGPSRAFAGIVIYAAADLNHKSTCLSGATLSLS